MDGPAHATRGIALVAATAAGLVLLVAGPAATALEVAVGWAVVATGIGAWGRRPGSLTWLLTVVVGLVWWLRCLDADLAALHVGVLLHLLATIPTGRAATWPRRTVVSAGYAVGIPLAAFGPSIALAALWIAALGPVVVRWRSGGAVERRTLLPALVGAAAVVLGELVAPVWPPAAAVALLAWALALGAGLLRRSLDRAAVHDLAAELRSGLPPGRLQAALAAALHDPTARLVHRLPAGYVDVDGAAADPTPRSGRATIRLDRDGAEIGLLDHDAALAAEPDLLQAVAAGAAIALENERLHAEVRSRVREVEASRARIVAAADAAREQLERELNGGVAQRLATVALLLRLAGDDTGADERGALLDEADTELAEALADLRELARGIYPVLLTDAGLGPALTALADRSTVAVHVGEIAPQRLPSAVEQGCYAVAMTVLAHAVGAVELDLQVDDASAQLRIRVEGGVSGPLPGVADRVAALDGTLAVDSRPGATTVTATVPLPGGTP